MRLRVAIVLMLIWAPGATEAGTLNMKSAIEMTAYPASVVAEGDSLPGSVVVLGVDGMGIDDDVVEVEGNPAVSVADEPQADSPQTRARTTARSVILRVMVAPPDRAAQTESTVGSSVRTPNRIDECVLAESDRRTQCAWTRDR